jgi:hypothetical protein
MRVDRCTADEPLIEFELSRGLEHLARRAHDLGTDPVAGQEDDARRAHAGLRAEMLRRT